MLRVSRLADYAIVIMSYLAQCRDDPSTAQHIAAEVGVPLPTVKKLLKLLAHAGLVEATRGANGGYALLRAPDAVNIVDIIAAVEGDPSLVDCCSAKRECVRQTQCAIQSNWKTLNHFFVASLRKVSLEDMMRPLAEHALFSEFYEEEYIVKWADER